VRIVVSRHLARVACTAGRSRVVLKRTKQPSGLRPCATTNGPLQGDPKIQAAQKRLIGVFDTSTSFIWEDIRS
jgi:hypothetical protein